MLAPGCQQVQQGLPVPSASSPQVLLCGYYGEHNLGDDALLEVLLSQLPPGWRPLVCAADQEQVQRRFSVATTDRRQLGGVLRALSGCDGLVLGGGSLLQDATSFASLVYYGLLIAAARLQGKPVALWGQGLGPLHRRRSRLLVRALLGQVQAISWRDPASAALAAGWGIAAPVAGDPVWALPPRPWQGSGGAIVLCWRPVSQLEGEAWLPYLEALAALAQQNGREVLWLPFHQEQDRGLLDTLSRQGLVPPALAARSREVEVEDPAAALALFAGASLVLAMRLHGLILAALTGAPCAALSYDPKVAAAAAAIGCPLQELHQPVDANTLLRTWQATLEVPPSSERVEALRRQAGSHRQVLAGLFA